MVQLWRQVPPQTALELNYFGAFTACRVLLGEPPEGPGGFFQGAPWLRKKTLREIEVLSSQMPFFSAETQREPWVYHFEARFSGDPRPKELIEAVCQLFSSCVRSKTDVK